MADPRRLSFAGWSLGAARPAQVEIDPDAVQQRLAGLDPKQIVRPGLPRRDDVFLRPPPSESPEDPLIGRWAAVALHEDFDRARQALAPLLALRASQGIALREVPGLPGAPGLVSMRRPAGTKIDAWWDSLREATGGKPPHYVLLVGGPRRFPFEVQAAFEQEIVTGRIDFGDAWEQYRAWAEKLARYERGQMPVDRRALLYSFATDEATAQSHEELMSPLAARFRDPMLLFDRDARTARLCEALASSRPALVITASHGIECFDAPDEPDLWGALTDEGFVGATGTPLDAACVRGRDAFAPGAVVVSFACFSAGAPAESAHCALSEKVERAIPGGPFTSPLSQALLAHPEGPVAFVGHVDRATSESFKSRGATSGPAAFLDFVQWWMGRERGTLGQAMSGFRDAAASASQRAADVLARARKRPELITGNAATDALVRYYDATGYILLGDPVTRLAAT